MKKNKRSVYLLAPVVIGAFLASGSVLAEDTNLTVSEPSDALTTVSSSVADNLADASTTSGSAIAAIAETEASTETSSSEGTATSSEIASRADETTSEETQASTSETLETSETSATSESAPSEAATQSETASSEVVANSATTATQSETTTSESAATVSPKAATGAGGTATDVVTTESQALVTAAVTDKTLSIKYNGTIARNESVKFAVWSANNDQDDIIWYDANALGAAYVDLSKHKDYGVYNIHTYSFINGQAKGLNAMTVTVARPEVTTSISKTSEGHFDIVVSNVPSTITSVTIPVWSDKNNQDDIKWYNATKTSAGTYKVSVATSDHNNDRGHYQAHIYGTSSITGGLIGLAVTAGFDNVDTRANATVSMVNYAENKTTFDVVVAGNTSTKDITGVAIAVWSEDKDQDDIKWYTPQVSKNQASVTVNIANHSNTSDYYNVHVYVDYSDGSRSGTVLGSYKITKPAVKNDVTASLTSQGISLKLDSNTVTDYTKVKFAVWSADKGQDDIKWYDASASGTALAAYENHSGYGTYNIHTYSFENGQATGLSAKTITLAAPNIKTEITKTDEYTYTVTVSDVPLYVSSVTVPVWTSKNDQDDIKWTATTKSDTTTYTATISLKAHNYETGQYNVHVYGQSKLGGDHTIGLAATNGFKVEEVATSDIQVTVANYNAKAGTLDVVVAETANSKAIKSVQVAAWSEEKQENIHWYTSSTVTNGKVTLMVNERNHDYIQGTYTVHTYVDFTDGSRTGYNLGTYKLTAEKTGSASQGDYDVINKVIYLDAGHGGSDPGATYFGQYEKNLTLTMQNLVKSKLEAAGYTVVTTRTTDTFVDLLDRSKAANASQSDIFVSLHFNASSSSSASGIETYYYQYYSDYPSKINKTYHNDAERLSLSATLASDIQSALVSSTGGKNNGVQRNTFAVLRETTAPAVLLELGYISNASEYQKISTSAYQEKLANGIVAGIKKYYDNF